LRILSGMRIVAVADTHRFETELVIPDGDVFVHAGDLLRAGTLDELAHVAGRAGCEDLLRAVRRRQPALHLFGHIHQDGGFWSDGELKLANVTTWECERAPTVIDLDPQTGAVTPVSVPPAARKPA
jgi:hypothetical protein